MTSEGNRRLLKLGVQIKNDFSGVDAIICCFRMKPVNLNGTDLNFAHKSPFVIIFLRESLRQKFFFLFLEIFKEKRE